MRLTSSLLSKIKTEFKKATITKPEDFYGQSKIINTDLKEGLAKYNELTEKRDKILTQLAQEEKNYKQRAKRVKEEYENEVSKIIAKSYANVTAYKRVNNSEGANYYASFMAKVAETFDFETYKIPGQNVTTDEMKGFLEDLGDGNQLIKDDSQYDLSHFINNDPIKDEEKEDITRFCDDVTDEYDNLDEGIKEADSNIRAVEKYSEQLNKITGFALQKELIEERRKAINELKELKDSGIGIDGKVVDVKAADYFINNTYPKYKEEYDRLNSEITTFEKNKAIALEALKENIDFKAERDRIFELSKKLNVEAQKRRDRGENKKQVDEYEKEEFNKLKNEQLSLQEKENAIFAYQKNRLANESKAERVQAIKEQVIDKIDENKALVNSNQQLIKEHEQRIKEYQDLKEKQTLEQERLKQEELDKEKIEQEKIEQEKINGWQELHRQQGEGHRIEDTDDQPNFNEEASFENEVEDEKEIEEDVVRSKDEDVIRSRDGDKVTSIVIENKKEEEPEKEIKETKVEEVKEEVKVEEKKKTFKEELEDSEREFLAMLGQQTNMGGFSFSSKEDDYKAEVKNDIVIESNKKEEIEEKQEEINTNKNDIENENNIIDTSKKEEPKVKVQSQIEEGPKLTDIEKVEKYMKDFRKQYNDTKDKTGIYKNLKTFSDYRKNQGFDLDEHFEKDPIKKDQIKNENKLKTEGLYLMMKHDYENRGWFRKIFRPITSAIEKSRMNKFAEQNMTPEQKELADSHYEMLKNSKSLDGNEYSFANKENEKIEGIGIDTDLTNSKVNDVKEFEKVSTIEKSKEITNKME